METYFKPGTLLRSTAGGRVLLLGSTNPLSLSFFKHGSASAELKYGDILEVYKHNEYDFIIWSPRIQLFIPFYNFPRGTFVLANE